MSESKESMTARMSQMTGETNPNLPDILVYSWQKRRDYLLLVAAVAASDGEIHPDEVKLLKKWADLFHLSKKSKDLVLSAEKPLPVPLDILQKRLARTDLVYSLLLDMMGMAMADGVLMDNEIDLLREVAEALQFDFEEFRILIEFVHSAHQAALLSNPEPLYEHNIENAFQLLSERNVQLFPHTLLCSSSPEFDQKLKSRWNQLH